MFLKVTSPVPEKIRLAKNLGCFAAALEKEGFFISQEEGRQLLICETDARHFLESLLPWSYDAANEKYYAAQAAYRADPSPENEAAFAPVSDRQKLKLHHSQMSREINAAGGSYARAKVIPLVAPIMARALAAVQVHLDELKEHERHLRAEYGLDATVRAADARGVSMETVPYSPIVLALEVELKNFAVRLAELEKGSMGYGPQAPSSFLRGIVLFFEE